MTALQTPVIRSAGGELLSGATGAALMELVERIQQEPPYSYKPGEIRPAVEWFPPLLDVARVAAIATIADAPVGYCVSLPIQAYGKLNDLLGRLGVDPASTEYLAELGVDRSVRRRGIASALLEHMHDALPSTTNAVVVRTLTDNAAAVAFYERHDYQLVEGLEQLWNGRPRLFLTRRSADG